MRRHSPSLEGTNKSRGIRNMTEFARELRSDHSIPSCSSSYSVSDGVVQPDSRKIRHLSGVPSISSRRSKAPSTLPRIECTVPAAGNSDRIITQYASFPKWFKPCTEPPAPTRSTFEPTLTTSEASVPQRSERCRGRSINSTKPRQDSIEKTAPLPASASQKPRTLQQKDRSVGPPHRHATMPTVKVPSGSRNLQPRSASLTRRVADTATRASSQARLFGDRVLQRGLSNAGSGWAGHNRALDWEKPCQHVFDPRGRRISAQKAREQHLARAAPERPVQACGGRPQGSRNPSRSPRHRRSVSRGRHVVCPTHAHPSAASLWNESGQWPKGTPLQTIHPALRPTEFGAGGDQKQTAPSPPKTPLKDTQNDQPSRTHDRLPQEGFGANDARAPTLSHEHLSPKPLTIRRNPLPHTRVSPTAPTHGWTPPHDKHVHPAKRELRFDADYPTVEELFAIDQQVADADIPETSRPAMHEEAHRLLAQFARPSMDSSDDDIIVDIFDRGSHASWRATEWADANTIYSDYRRFPRERR